MKVRLSLILFVVLTVSTTFAQEITLTTTKTNLLASKATIEMPGLSGNSEAIIFAAPIGETARLNPHPIGAWYYNDKWNIFNTDHANMSVGLKFKVEVFLRPDANHFLHIIKKDNLIGGESYIDNRLLNDNPKAKVQIFQNHAPDNRSGSLNKYEVTAEYNQNSGKWFIKNTNGEQLTPNTAYNIIVSTGTKGDGGGTGETTTTPPTSVIGIQTYFKNDIVPNIFPASGSFLIDGMSHDIVLAKKSRLVISGMLMAPSQLELWLKVDGSRVYIAKATPIISNFMIELAAGNHKIEFWRFGYTTINPNSLTGKSSSIIVIPLE